MDSAIINSVYTFLASLGYHHPIHPTQVHIPVGLVFGAFTLGTLGLVRRQPRLICCAWHCMNLALIFLIPTVLTGLMDWQHFYAGAMLFPFKMKFILAGGLCFLLAAGFVCGRRSQGEAQGMVAIYALALLVVAGLGYFGGELVYGRKSSSPEPQFRVGQTLYLENCGGCHANGGNVANPARPVKNSPKSSDFNTFLGWVRAPEAPMPAFPGSILSDAEVKDLFEYVSKVLNKS